jgi:hypothetical protein
MPDRALDTGLCVSSDPTWIAGIYDAGDFDDVVWMLVELCVSDRAPVSHTADVPRASRLIANAISKDLSSVIDLAALPRPATSSLTSISVRN